MLKRKYKFDLFDAFVTIALFLLGAATLFPMVHIFAVSITDPAFMDGTIYFFPEKVSWISYRITFNQTNLATGYLNSIVYTVVFTLFALVITTLTAYSLSKTDLIWRNGFTFYFIFTMFFSGGLIPTFLVIKGLGMVNTIWAMVIPGALSMWNMIIMRTYFAAIPKELEEAAYMDGASVLGTLVRIILPLSMPVLATIGLFYGIAKWNDFFTALIYLSDGNKFPLQLVLRDLILGTTLQSKMEYINSQEIGYLKNVDIMDMRTSLQYTSLFVSILPILIVYPFIQKYFVKGVMIGSLKG